MVFSLLLFAVSSAARLSEGEDKSPAVPDPESQQLLEKIAKENSAPPWTYAELTHRADCRAAL